MEQTFIILFCIIQVVASQVSLTIQTNPLIFNREVLLECKVTGSCCETSSRSWRRGPSNILIMTNGNPSTGYESKFKEDRNDASGYFSLTINDIAESDVDMDYTCSYGFNSDTVTLSSTSNFYWISSGIIITETDTITFKGKNKFGRRIIVSKSAPAPNITATFDGKTLNPITSAVNYNSIFYNMTILVNDDFSCPASSLKVIATILDGSSVVDTTNLIDEDVCRCNECALYCFLISLIKPAMYSLILIALLIKWGFQQVRNCLSEKLTLKSKLVVGFVVAVSIPGHLIVPALIGKFHCTCLGSSSYVFAVIISVGIVILGYTIAYIVQKMWLDEHQLKNIMLWITVIDLFCGLIVAVYCLTMYLKGTLDWMTLCMSRDVH